MQAVPCFPRLKVHHGVESDVRGGKGAVVNWMGWLTKEPVGKMNGKGGEMGEMMTDEGGRVMEVHGTGVLPWFFIVECSCCRHTCTLFHTTTGTILTRPLLLLMISVRLVIVECHLMFDW